MLLFTGFPKDESSSLSPPAEVILGDEDEVVYSIKQLLRGDLLSSHLLAPSVYVWSAPSGGKSMLLSAARIVARQNGVAAYWLDAAATAVEDSMPLASGLLIIDNIDHVSSDGALAIIQWLNRCYHQAGYFFLASGSQPPNQLALNKEMTTRLAKGLVFNLRPLNDDEKKAALLAHARARGFALEAEIVDLLLAYLPRNMNSLLSVLEELDNFFLNQKKDITPSRVRAWLETHSQNATTNDLR